MRNLSVNVFEGSHNVEDHFSPPEEESDERDRDQRNQPSWTHFDILALNLTEVLRFNNLRKILDVPWVFIKKVQGTCLVCSVLPNSAILEKIDTHTSFNLEDLLNLKGESSLTGVKKCKFMIPIN